MTAIALLRGCQLCNCPVENHGVTRYEFGNQLDYGTPQILHLENLEESKAYIKCDKLLMDRWVHGWVRGWYVDESLDGSLCGSSVGLLLGGSFRPGPLRWVHRDPPKVKVASTNILFSDQCVISGASGSWIAPTGARRMPFKADCASVVLSKQLPFGTFRESIRSFFSLPLCTKINP